MTAIDETIRRVRELSESATKGPWYPSSGPWVGLAFGVLDDGNECVAACREPTPNADRHNAALIAYYRTAAPLLADECERLRERVRVLEEALRDIVGYEMPMSGSVAHQVCADMRDDARAALKGGE